MKKTLLVTALFSSTLFSSWSFADTPAELLQDALKGYDRFSAEFEQMTKTEQSVTSEVSQGQFFVEKPGKFRWETYTPFPQTIVSDGEYVWIYDPDLEQATRKPVQNADANGAAMILNGDVDGLNKEYEIELTNKAQSDKVQVFQLTPRSDQSSFQQIVIYFNDGVMSELMLEDVLGQETTIMMQKPEVNPDMDESLFHFDPPEGVDVLISDEA
jgi:outer membrane lipoprotein carrier protein